MVRRYSNTYYSDNRSNTHVDLLDKDGNIIGSGTTDDTGHVTITPTKPIPEGNVTAKATDNRTSE